MFAVKRLAAVIASTALVVGGLVAGGATAVPTAGAATTGTAVESPQGLWYDPANSNPLLQSFVSELETEFNNERAARGLDPINWTATPALDLQSIAENWANQEISAAEPYEDNPNLAEDIAQYPALTPYNYFGEVEGTTESTIGDMTVGLMGSEPHRDIIVTPGVAYAGAGIACDADNYGAPTSGSGGWSCFVVVDMASTTAWLTSSPYDPIVTTVSSGSPTSDLIPVFPGGTVDSEGDYFSPLDVGSTTSPGPGEVTFSWPAATTVPGADPLTGYTLMFEPPGYTTDCLDNGYPPATLPTGCEEVNVGPDVTSYTLQNVPAGNWGAYIWADSDLYYPTFAQLPSITVDAASLELTAPPATLTAPSGQTDSETLTVTNDGGPTGAVSAALSGSDPSLFSATPSSSCASLAAGDSCTVAVTFAPGSTPNGTTVTAGLTLSLPGENSATTTLTGLVQVPNLAVAPSATLPSTLPGETSNTTLSVTNNSSSTVDVTASIAGTDSSAFTATPATSCASLASEASCTVDVAFSPPSSSTAGTYSAALDLTAGSLDASVSLAGSVPEPLAAAPESVSLRAPLGGSATTTVTATNDSSESGAVTATTTGPFSVTPDAACATLAEGTDCESVVTFTVPPGAAPGSTYSGTLTFTGPTGATASVALHGSTPPAGYVILTSNGGVSNFDAPWYGSPKASGSASPGVVGIAATPGGGYDVLRANGGVDNYGATWYGSLAGKLPSGVTAVGIAVDPATGGYWILTSNGSVSNFDAPWDGSPKASGSAGPFTGIVAAPGGGYYVLEANGGVDNYGTPWHGSLAGKLPAGVTAVGIAADQATGGYWVLTSNGSVANFDAPWYGSPKASGSGGAGPFTGLAAATGGFGYFVSRSNGGVFTYGVPWQGSLAYRLPYGVTGIGVAS